MWCVSVLEFVCGSHETAKVMCDLVVVLTNVLSK